MSQPESDSDQVITQQYSHCLKLKLKPLRM